MTMSEIVEDVLGVEGTFPRPGWVVLDAIRERRFTGEVAFDTTPEVRVYADRGRIYLAERASDSSLGARLVDAGALNASQLDHGAMRIGDAEYLGRLFERVPSVDRQKVVVTADLMTEECIGSIARMRISDIAVTPYRHHASGAHRWDQPAVPAFDLAAGDPLPAPAPDAAPVAIGPPEPLFRSVDDVADVDDMIRWNEPSWLDEQVAPLTPLRPIDVAARFAALRAAADEEEEQAPIAVDFPVLEPTAAMSESSAPTESPEPAPVAPPAAEHQPGDDWIDNLATAGLPHRGSDPLASPVKLTPLAPEPADHFELIWPSGDIDEQFGSETSEPFPHPDIDRAGVTARLVGRRPRITPDPEIEAALAPAPPVGDSVDAWLGGEDGREAITDDVVLAVRRAVASIDTGSLAARRRLAEVPATVVADRGAGAGPVTLPGRVAVRTDSAETAPVARGHVSGTSVFDNLPPIEQVPSTNEVATEAATSATDESQRTGALRRLIGSLRRR